MGYGINFGPDYMDKLGLEAPTTSKEPRCSFCGRKVEETTATHGTGKLNFSGHILKAFNEPRHVVDEKITVTSDKVVACPSCCLNITPRMRKCPACKGKGCGLCHGTGHDGIESQGIQFPESEG